MNPRLRINILAVFIDESRDSKDDINHEAYGLNIACSRGLMSSVLQLRKLDLNLTLFKVILILQQSHVSTDYICDSRFVKVSSSSYSGYNMHSNITTTTAPAPNLLPLTQNPKFEQFRNGFLDSLKCLPNGYYSCNMLQMADKFRCNNVDP